MLKRILIAGLLNSLTSLAPAAEHSAQLQELAAHKTWQRLLHYESLLPGSAPRSAIHSEEFFLSPDGQSDSLAELVATLGALSSAAGDEKADDHPVCRFPARVLWLSQQIPELNLAVSLEECSAFNEWRMAGELRSVSFVYADGYLGNPASYYGHNLLKLNGPADPGSSLLDTSLNYGAVVPEGENPVSYIFKGVFGGYDGGFSHIRYYFHNHNYGEEELRDLWEYELALTDQQRDLLVAHGWELLGQRYTYYFFRRNCAYRMAELLELVGIEDVIPDTGIYTMPQQILKNLVNAQQNGQPVIAAVHHLPSRQKQFQRYFRQLDAAEQQAVTDSVGEGLAAESYTALDYSSRIRVLDNLLDYYRFADVADALDAEQIKEARRQVLLERYRLPPGKANWLAEAAELSPDQARDPGLVRISALARKSQPDALQLHIRPAYYDPLDAAPYHTPYSGLSMGAFTLEYSDERAALHDFTFVDIESVTPAVSGLPGDQGAAWLLRAVWEPQSTECDRCGGLRGEAAGGLVFQPAGDAITGVLYLGGGIQEGHAGKGHLFMRSQLVLQASAGANTQLRLNIRDRHFADERAEADQMFALEGRYALSKDDEVRVELVREGIAALKLGYGFYF